MKARHVNQGKIKLLAKRLGELSLVDRLGLRNPLSEWVRLILSRAERDRRRIIKKDYQVSRNRLRRIGQGAPTGDPNKVALMVSTMPTVWGLKREGVLALALRLEEFTPKIVELSSNSWTRRYHRLFGNQHFIDFQRFKSGSTSNQLAPELVEFTRSNPTVQDLLSLRFRRVDVGRVLLSNITERYRLSKIDLSDPGMREEIRTGLLEVQRNIAAAEMMLDQERPVVALMLEKGLSPAAEIFGASLARAIPVVQYSGSQDTNAYVLKRFTEENRHQDNFSLDAHTWAKVKNMQWSETHESELLRDHADGYESGTWFDRKFLQAGKQIKSAKEARQQLDLDPDKKTAVIFSHVLWDGTFFYGDSLFEDYETWLVETVKAACANPAVNWVVKLHPDLVWKLNGSGRAGHMLETNAIDDAVGRLPEHVKIVPPETDISTYTFFKITDYCLTVRGTIGIEMAMHGVPVLTAGTGRYSELGFTIDSGSTAEYLELAADIQNTPPMTDHQIELARRFAYALFKLRPWPMRSFKRVRLSIDQSGHPLEDNLIPCVETFDQFAAATDMRDFAKWVASDQTDYLRTIPA